MSIIKTPELSEKAYDILVEECGANPAKRQDFCEHHNSSLNTDQELSEWRFGGPLGNGGKFKQHNGVYYVTCYPEDRTAERNEIIRRANHRLAVLFDTE